MFKSKITRIISMASAVACMATCINFASVVNVSDAEAVEVKDAFTITEEMGLGWNLGNTLDSYNGNLETMGLESETCWGNPKTTPEMIKAVKDKGFNTVRVPVTWHQHVDKANGYKISDEYLARVKEVVDYCYNNGMYVILNMHHEEGWQNSSTLGQDYDRIAPFVTGVWKQLAETFKDYDQHLIFETMNEPRATGTDHEWWGPQQDEVDTINKLNAAALEVIRSVKSDYNQNRLVMMPGYCASSDITMMSKVVIPDDDFVAASVHAYTPYGFAMDAKSDHTKFTDSYKNELINVMDGIRKTFSDKDIPVVLGEFSASNFDNTEARCDWATAYMETTKAYGFPCVLWDNNVKGNNEGEAHGYLNRSDNTWYEPSEPVIDAMLKVLNDSSIKWGSQRKSPVISHDDISTGKVIDSGSHDIDASIKDGGCSPAVLIKWADLDGKDVAVKYKGEAPVLAFMDSNWKNWTEVKPYDIDEKNGIAYYSSKHISSAWGEDKLDELSSILTRTNGVTTIESIVIIGGGEVVDTPPEEEAKVYPADLTKTDRKTITFTVKGKAGSVTNGCVGYMAADWEMITWEGTIGSDGTLDITVDISSIPANINAAQIQIWWCDDKEADLTVNYGGTSTETTTTVTTTGTETSTTTTVSSSETSTTTTEQGDIGEQKYLAGDANCDGDVDIADATAIIQHLGNRDKYGLTEQGEENADVDGVKGVTGSDALTLQKLEAGLIDIKDLPLKAS